MKIKINEFLTKLIILCSLVMLAFTGVIGISTSKLCLYLIVGLCLLKLYFFRIQRRQLVALALILLSCVVSAYLYGENPANNLIFVTSITLAMTLFRDGLEESSWKLLKVVTVLASAWFVLQYLSGTGFDDLGRLILFFDNPNMTGIALCAPAMLLVLMTAEEKNRFYRLFYGLLAVAMTYLVYQTNNRGSFLTLVLFAVFAVLAMSEKHSFRLTNKGVYAILKLTPLVVMLVYVFLYTVLPSNLEFLGKPFFSGREQAWKSALEQLFTNPFVRHTYEDGTLNLFLEGARRYGIFAMVGFFWVLFTLQKTDLKTTNARNYLAYLGFHLYLFQQSFESTMILGSYSVYVWSYILLGIASMNIPEQETLSDCCSG